MMSILRLSAIAMTVAALAACGGSGGDGGTGTQQPTSPAPPTPTPPAAPKFFELENSAEDLFSKYDSAEFSDESMIPFSGTADYDGPFLFDLSDYYGEDRSIAGEGDLSFDFSRGDALSGTISNFVREDETEVSGTIELSNSEIDRSSGSFSSSSYEGTVEANLTGILQDQEGETITITGELIGDFRGPNREGLIGEAGGIFTVDGQGYEWDGEFYTEQ